MSSTQFCGARQLVITCSRKAHASGLEIAGTEILERNVVSRPSRRDILKEFTVRRKQNQDEVQFVKSIIRAAP
jgi:hypothetical protein